MNVVHISAECYPVAKAGGLGDVVGALPKYLNKVGDTASVILPHYYNKWMQHADTKLLYEGRAPFGTSSFAFRVSRLIQPDLGFDLFLIDIPGRFDRPGIYLDPWSGYAYWDEMERFFSFQISALEWLKSGDIAVDILHCHDHHTALIPFMTSQCERYRDFAEVPTILTIHNGEYQGRYSMGDASLIPPFNPANTGLLDWGGSLNALAAGIKSAWRVSTVSEGYLEELQMYCHGLEILLRDERGKSSGILNGIDTEVWDPETDPFLDRKYTSKTVSDGKQENKSLLLDHFQLESGRPVFSFIGRLVREKGADLLPDLIREAYNSGIDATFVVLGTGDPYLHSIFESLENNYTGYFDSRLEYNETLAHLIYAGSDFLLMPSRVEPCGLNQLYSMRYGTLPVVRKTGGLADTVIDIGEKGGYGIVFEQFSLDEALNAVKRGVELYNNTARFNQLRKKAMGLNFSWEKAARNYQELYQSIK